MWYGRQHPVSDCRPDQTPCIYPNRQRDLIVAFAPSRTVRIRCSLLWTARPFTTQVCWGLNRYSINDCKRSVSILIQNFNPLFRKDLSLKLSKPHWPSLFFLESAITLLEIRLGTDLWLNYLNMTVKIVKRCVTASCTFRTAELPQLNLFNTKWTLLS